MTVELRPLGVNCNIACQYCYQNMHRDAGQVAKSYDLDAMKTAIEEIGGPFHLFGGEPLLVPEDDLEDLFVWGLEKYGENGIQTNGVLINDNHIRMFRKYRVTVGISIDGPGELNDARWNGTLERTREATLRSEQAIELLYSNGIMPGIMVQLNRCNASADRLPRLCDWFMELDAMGISSARLHILEIENELIRQKYGLSPTENVAAFKACCDLEARLSRLSFDVFDDQKQMLLMQDDEITCTWRGCDPYTTEAVNGVGGNGERHNCGLTDKEGINFQKPDAQGYERYLALYLTPHEFGGCKDCRFFLACKGQCPGTAIDRDWRNRTENCEVWQTMFELAESTLLNQGMTPLSVHPVRDRVETAMVSAWEKGENPTLESLAEKFGVKTTASELPFRVDVSDWAIGE